MPDRTNYVYGPKSLGHTTLGTVVSTGNIFYVDSNSSLAADEPSHGAQGKPFATIDYAVGQCTANNGDHILVAENHAENISSATSLVVDVAGLTIVGLGHGDARPTLTYTATAGSIELDAADTVLQNVILKASVSAVVVGVNVDANNVKLIEVEWTFDATGDDFLIYADIEDVSGAELRGCIFRAEESTAGANEAVRLDNADNAKIIGCYSFGDFANAVIYSDTSGDTGNGSTISNGIELRDNVLYNDDTGNSICIDLNNADTGVIAYNALCTNASKGVAAALDPGSCICIENYANSQTDRTGGVVPATADTIA